MKDAVEKANQLGLRTEKGEPVTYKVVQRYMSKVVQRLVPLEDVENTFAQFAADNLKPKKGSMVQASAIHSAYKMWCRRKGIVPLSTWKSGNWLRSNESLKTEKWYGFEFYSDIEMPSFPNVFNSGDWCKSIDNGVRGEMVTYLGRKGKKPPK